MKLGFLVLPLLCSGCVVTQSRMAVQSIAPAPPKIGLKWNAGYNLINGASPRTSGIEGTADFKHWFAETNLPVVYQQQEMICVFPIAGPYRFFRAVDRY